MNELFKSMYVPADEDTRYELDERAAIHEFDGWLSRDEAEQRTAEEWIESKKTLQQVLLI